MRDDEKEEEEKEGRSEHDDRSISWIMTHMGDVFRVLGGDDDSVDADRDGATILFLVFHCDLGLAIWTNPWAYTILAHLES